MDCEELPISGRVIFQDSSLKLLVYKHDSVFSLQLYKLIVVVVSDLKLENKVKKKIDLDFLPRS